jgi:Leucine-rich repeat (LRR) protein
MTNQLNPVQSQPVSLLNQIISFIITRDLQNSLTIDDNICLLVNDTLGKVWRDLKHSPQDFSLEHTMLNIETSFVKDQQRNRNITFSPEELKDCLAKNTKIFFKNLAGKFQAKKIFGDRIPVDISSYKLLQKIWEDEALQKIWDHLRSFMLIESVPTSLYQIKAWLKDPANATQLNSIQGLDLSRLELRAIPPEISVLTGLQWLYLNDNQISNIPDSISHFPQLRLLSLQNNQISSIPDSLSRLLQLQELHLGSNQISNIPDSLSKLLQLHILALAHNQISSIPDSLSHLPQLQWLYLDNNQISSIPDSLSNFFQLQWLSLNSNKINGIPDSLSRLPQLQWLYLDNNQISSIPDSLSRLPQLQWLYLDNNQISSIPDSLSNFFQLQRLFLNSNKINSIPNSLGNLSQLKSLSLARNQISSMPNSLGNLSQLKSLSLAHNQISSIPDSLSNLPQLKRLVLDDNPLLLFVYDKRSTTRVSELFSKYSEFKEYKCLSSFSNLCQLIVRKNDQHEMIKEVFLNLKRNDQNLIFEMIYKESGVHSDDPIWGENHVFDNMNIFYRAVKKAIAAKFDRLSLKKQNAVYGEIYHLAQPETLDPKWGEHYAFDNVLRLVDAMDRIE